MRKTIIKRNLSRERRVLRVRNKIRGTTNRPRLCVHKSNKHLYVQLISDENQKTLAGLGTGSKELKDLNLNKKSKEAARYLGKAIAELAKKQNILEVVFDRGLYKYHGIIAELATAARETGLQF